jgi:hypothetical protein
MTDSIQQTSAFNREEIVIMKPFARLIALTFALGAFGLAAFVRADTPATTPLVGELRVFAIGPANKAAIARMHKQGWLEARGQVVSKSEYPDLYDTIGRTWTADKTPANQFALPDLRDRFEQRSSANPFGVMGAGDLLTGSAKRTPLTDPLTYWIYVGPDAGSRMTQTQR